MKLLGDFSNVLICGKMVATHDYNNGSFSSFWLRS